MKSFISLWFIMVEVVISRKHFRPLSEMLHLFNLFRSENCICAMQKQMTFQLFALRMPKTTRKNLERIKKEWKTVKMMRTWNKMMIGTVHVTTIHKNIALPNNHYYISLQLHYIMDRFFEGFSWIKNSHNRFVLSHSRTVTFYC